MCNENNCKHNVNALLRPTLAEAVKRTPTKWTTESVRAYVEAEGYAIAVEDWKYVNANAIIPLLCLQGHRADKRFESFQRGKRCATCSGNAKYTSAFVRNTVEADRYAIRDADW
ncbi:MAG: hypothetical protein C6Y22_30375, partial [Hapalosiphonaceae cyanobacterium JJU2]